LASRRRRRKSIGKVIVDVERRVRRVEKRPGAKRLKTNVVTTEKLGYRAVSTKTIKVDAVETENIATDAVTANEAEFGVTVVSATDPAIVKEGTTVVDPVTGAQKVYSTDISDFVTVTDPAAQAAADEKNSTYYQDAEPTGGTYLVGDMWVDTDDDNKLYTWDGTDWVLTQDSATAQATADGKVKTYVQDDQPTGGAYNVGDLWIDTNDGNKLYRYSGTAWVSAQDTAISTAQSTANGKNKVFYSTSAPGSTANTAGDIWWQYASGIVIGQFVGAGGTSWTSAPIGNAVIANLDAGKITTGYLDVSGSVVFTTDKTKSGNQSRIEINSLGFYAYDGSTATVSITNTGSAIFTGEVKAGSFTGSISSTATITGGAFVTTGNVGSFTGNSLTISGGAISAGKVVSLSTTTALSDGVISLDTDYIALSAGIETEIFGAIKMSGNTTFFGSNNSIGIDTDVGGSSTKNIRNVWIRTTLISATSTSGNIGDIWLQYA
jgi:hypothetical protein